MKSKNGSGKPKPEPKKPKGCDNVPYLGACKKTKRNGGMLCKNCDVWK